jgi:UDP-3-O-[3-hydroxymyristoyl] glucosamine N-acyltransferase
MEDAARGRKEALLVSKITIKEIHELLRLEKSEDERFFVRVSSHEEADLESIVFAQDELAFEKALASAAGLILAPQGAVYPPDGRVLRVKNPKHAFAVCGRWLDGFSPVVVHPAAAIDGEARVGKRTSVGAGAVIEAGAVVGERCVIGANVTIYGTTQIGDGVLVQAGAVLGAMGFGYVRGEDGSYVRFPQQGLLVIEDEVEIGANTTIDRGALGETRIGCGTKIDNQVHIGHNCRIGKNVVIAAQVGISGSCVVADGAVLAGQVGLGDHVSIGPGVILGGASGVFPGKRLEGPGQMFMGVPAVPLKEYLKTEARVRRLKDREQGLGNRE